MSRGSEEGCLSDIYVKGNVTSGGDGLLYENVGFGRTGTTAKIRIGGDVKSNGDPVAFAASNGTTDVSIGGSITRRGENDELLGYGYRGGVSLTTYNDDTVCNMDVAGSITSDYVGADLSATESSTINLKAHKDVTGGDIGIMYAPTDEATESTNALVEGTISGKKAGVVLYRRPESPIGPIRPQGVSESQRTKGDGIGDNLKRLDLTTWKIAPNKDGAVACIMVVTRPDGLILLQDEKMEKEIKYIVKVEQPKEGGKISAVDANGTALEKSYGWDVAHEGERVRLKADLEEGYTLKTAYNGLGDKVELRKDDAGQYYLDVPKGGGVYLSAELEKTETSEETPKQPTEETKKPVKDTKDKAKDSGKATSAKTGDESSPMLWVGVLVVAVLGLCLLAVRAFVAKRNKKQK